MLNIFFENAAECNKEWEIMRKDWGTSSISRHNYDNDLVSTKKNMATCLPGGCLHTSICLSLNRRRCSFPVPPLVTCSGLTDWLLLSVWKRESHVVCLQWRSRTGIQAVQASSHETTCRDTRTLFAHRGQYPPQPRWKWHKQTRTARWLKKLPANNAKWKDINI